MLQPRIIDLPRDAGASAAEAAEGLQRTPACLSPKLFYDALGSRLFDAITELPEYYPTRTEAGLFATHGHAIAQAVLHSTGPRPVIVDLGAGNCAKAAALFPLISPRRYVAVDISVEHMAASLASLQQAHPALELTGVGLDFSRRLALPAGLADGGALVFYPGSSIGNFDPPGAVSLLRQAREVARQQGALLIGVDLVKDEATLVAAYDDALGVTAAFNLNLLRHLNRLLEADFDVRQWRHVALYNREASRIEMHLEARERLRVCWRGGAREFVAGERMHTENSYKWTLAAFADLLRSAGFREPRSWTDAAGYFALFVAAA